MKNLFVTEGPSATVLVRLVPGVVFLSEGIQKFLFPTEQGIGRFTKIGIPSPHFFAPFVGAVEIIGGALLIFGLLTRLASLVLIVDMMVAIATTKIPMFSSKGFWAMAHESRTDWSMLLCCVFLLVVGGGTISIDAKFAKKGGTR